jgi:flavin-dependent dehydrogenase
VTDVTAPSAREAIDVDVCVVGGGTAGLQAALQLARIGRSVTLLERRPAGKGGARWCNGVVAWQFERAGLEPPVEPERRGGGGASHMLSPSGRHRLRIDTNPVIEADMRLLGDRMASLATAAGADLRHGVTDVEVRLERGRPVAVAALQEGRPIEVRARLFVDASGRGGVVRRQVPAIDALCPEATGGDLCSAQHLILRVADPVAAKAWLDEQGALPHEAVLEVGIDGGYSTVNIQLDPSFEEVSVLTGCIPGPGTTSGHAMMRRVRERHEWIGAPVFGGGALIPLRRTYDRFTAPGVALVGDAAAQVMAAHGSGIGFGLIAGKVLAEAVGSAPDPGDPDVLWRYQARYQREFGAILAAYDAVRRMTVRLGPEGVEDLFATGIFSPALVLPGLEQRLGSLSVSEMGAASRAQAKRRDLARIVMPALAAMAAARPIYRAYPAERSERAFAAWAATVRRALPRQGAA